MTEPAPESRVHTWPVRALVGDYARAGAGFAVTFFPMLLVRHAPIAVTVLGALAALFAWLAQRTFARQRARIVAGPDGIRRGRKAIAWRDLAQVRGRRFDARRKDGGYIELTLAAPGARITLDSRISDFVTLARAVRDAAHANGLVPDTRTRAAFAALGLEL